MKVSEQGINLLKQFEGCKLQTYKDSVGVPTIGFGHTGPDVEMGQTITQEEAAGMLRLALLKFEDCIIEYCDVALDQNEFDALVVFAYNVGCAAFMKSTLLKLLNAGKKEGAADQFLRWDKAGGLRVAGLTRRREAERDLFLA